MFTFIVAGDFIFCFVMQQQKVIEIPLSKGKLVKGLVTSIVFVAAGVWILLNENVTARGPLSLPVLRYLVGIASVVVFAALGALYLFKLKDTRPGFVIDENGIIDNSGALAAGFVPWTDIHHFSTVKMMKQEFLVIGVNNPLYYLHQQKSVLRKKGMQYNYKNYGSPIAISTNTLKCKLPELLAMLEERQADRTKIY